VGKEGNEGRPNHRYPLVVDAISATVAAPGRDAKDRIRRREIITTVGGTAAIWVLGSHLVVLRPFVWLATLVHEASHAFVATLLGLHVSTVTINSLGGGLTNYTGHPSTAKIVAIGSAGYVGAALVGGLMIELCRRLQGARVGTAFLALLVALVGIAWVPWSFRPNGAMAAVTGSSSADGHFTTLFCVITVVVLAAMAIQPFGRPRRVLLLMIATTLCLASIDSLKLVTNISSHGGDSDASIVAAVTPLSSWMWSVTWFLIGTAACILCAWSAVGRDRQ
jgi:hypothetical protein